MPELPQKSSLLLRPTVVHAVDLIRSAAGITVTTKLTLTRLPLLQVEVQAASEQDLAMWDGWVHSRLRHLVARLEPVVNVSRPEQTGYWWRPPCTVLLPAEP